MTGNYLMKYLVNPHTEKFNSPKFLEAIQAAHVFFIWASLHAMLNSHYEAGSMESQEKEKMVPINFKLLIQ